MPTVLMVFLVFWMFFGTFQQLRFVQLTPSHVLPRLPAPARTQRAIRRNGLVHSPRPFLFSINVWTVDGKLTEVRIESSTQVGCSRMHIPRFIEIPFALAMLHVFVHAGAESSALKSPLADRSLLQAEPNRMAVAWLLYEQCRISRETNFPDVASVSVTPFDERSQ